MMPMYTLNMRDDYSTETTTIDAADDDAVRDLAEDEVRDWVREGNWGDDGASISTHYSLTDEDDNTVAESSLTVVIEPDHDALITAAGGDPDCDHDWTSEGEGGCSENPGVWLRSGTALTIDAHCRTCGLHRTNQVTGAQRNPGEHDTVEYEQPESWCQDCQRQDCECED